MTHATTSSPLTELSDALADVVESAGGWVVRVEARRGHAATGMVWTQEGHVLTADHVVQRDEDIQITLAGGEIAPASVVARDPGSDLALLRVDRQGLTAAPRAGDGEARVGHLAIALGRPGESLMASLGIVSATGSPWRTARGAQLEGYLRTDATLYTGFSGGPLVDVSGRVIAINSWTLSQGAGLAIPVGLASTIADALAAGGVKRAYLGVGTQAVPLPEGIRSQAGQERGLILVAVEPGGPADKSGLLIGDVLLSIAGQPLEDAEELVAQLTPDKVGQQVDVRLVRGGEIREIVVTPGQRA